VANPVDISRQNFEQWWKAIPVFSAGIAIAFDVGYFWGIDINLFTLFSLAEHILFALEAAPFALVLIVAFLAVHPWLDRAIAIIEARTRKRSYRRFRLLATYGLVMLYGIGSYPIMGLHGVALSILMLLMAVSLQLAPPTGRRHLILGWAAIFRDSICLCRGPFHSSTICCGHRGFAIS
jgi:hypothetical protein